MNTRRHFFKQFIGQIGVLRDDIRGVENIPLNRLNELPEDIVDEIEPIFFTDEKWEKNKSSLLIQNPKDGGIIRIDLVPEEELAIELFQQNLTIENISKQVENEFNISYNKAREICSLLFFRLATHRVCHPRKVYNINELSTKSDKNE